MSKLVPPMSVQTTLRRPIWSASQRAHTADRAGHERGGELVGVDGDGAAVARHHAELEAGAGVLGALADGAQRASRRFRRVSLDHGGVQAREVAAGGVELARDEQRAVAVEPARVLLLLEDLLHARLVGGVAVGEEQRHADALDAIVEQGSRGFSYVLLAQGQHLVAEQVDAASDTVHSLARDQGRVVVVGGDVEAVGVRVAEVRLDAALHLERVLLPGGDDHAHVEALALQQAIEHRGAAEHAGVDAREGVARLEVPLPERVLRGVHQSVALVLGGRLGLAHYEAPTLVDDERVRHRAAGIDRQHARRVLHPSLLRSLPGGNVDEGCCDVNVLCR
jgi:hypothetical protein